MTCQLIFYDIISIAPLENLHRKAVSHSVCVILDICTTISKSKAFPAIIKNINL